MTPEQRERWNTLIREAQAGYGNGSQCAPAPLDLLLSVDLELCALETLFAFRQPGSRTEVESPSVV